MRIWIAAAALLAHGCASEPKQLPLSSGCKAAFARGETSYLAADGLTHACPLSRAPANVRRLTPDPEEWSCIGPGDDAYGELVMESGRDGPFCPGDVQ